MEPARSLLFIPGNRERFYDKAPTLAADGFIVDLEDGVPVDEKATARDLARQRIGSLGRPTWVRINALDSTELAPDLDAIVGLAGLAGLMLPKTDSPDAIRELDGALARLEQARGAEVGSTRLIAMIESSRGVLSTFDIASASARVRSVCIGGARDGDLQTDLGSGWSIDGPELLYARQHVLLAARAAGIAWPLDGVFAEVTDADGFARDCGLSRSLGYRGRTVIHPGQIEPANRIYAPTEAELDYYRRVVDAFAAAEAAGQATTLVEGRLVDYAMVRNARRWLDLADTFDDER